MSRRESLDIATDMRFQRIIWKIQPIGWVLMALVTIAGILGTFGGFGPLNQSMQAGSSFVAYFERFPPYRGDHAIRFDCNSHDRNDMIMISVNSDYLEKMHPESFTPKPAQSYVRGNRTHYEFLFGQAPATILIDFRARHAGLAVGRFAVGEESMVIRQFVFP